MLGMDAAATALTAASLALLVGVVVAAVVVARSLAGIRGVIEAAAAGPEEGFRTRLAEMEHAVDLLPQRWEEMVHAAKRSENRTRALIRDARRELGESGIDSPALDAAASQLRLLDDESGGGEAMPAVHQDVESVAAPVQDWRAAGLRRKFGG